jgi:hypothetical protein
LIVLADNDIILKLAQCDLLECLPEILGEEWTEIFVTTTAKYQLLPKNPEKALNKCGNEETLERLTSFLGTTKILPAIQDSSLLSILGDVNEIDGGEKLLFAAAVELPNSILITGDRRALRALIEHQHRLSSIFATLQNSVITFETAILLAIRLLGFAIVKQKLLGSPKPDKMLRLVLKNETTETDLIECLCSYSKEVIPLLAFKQHLPSILS